MNVETNRGQTIWMVPNTMQNLPTMKLTGSRIATVSRSALILRKAELAVSRGEIWLGRRTLLEAVRQIPDFYRDNHIEYHREVIRGRSWPNQSRPSSLPQFLDEYEQAALAYIQVGFESLDYLVAGSPRQLENMFRRVEAAEALRGQYGKRSPTGIDARLNQYEEQLFDLLSEKLGNLAHSAIELLGTPIDPHVTAETALIEDFFSVTSQFPAAPRSDALVNGNRLGAERLWTFIRRHTGWSLPAALKLYDTFTSANFQFQINLCRSVRRQIAIARTELILKLEATYPKEWFVKVMDLATGLTLLNHLNLALEPCFSFKAGVGLGQGYIFDLAKEKGIAPTDDFRMLNKRKWRLFDLGTHNSIRMAIT